MRSSFFCLIPLLFFTQVCWAQTPQYAPEVDTLGPLQTSNFRIQKQWVDSIYQSMTLDEKIGQLFIPMAFSSKGKAEQKRISRLIEKYHIGGVIFSKGSPTKQAKMTNFFQKKSEVPLMIAMDAEWGLAMRLDSTFAFPWNLTLGAVQDLDLIRKVGKRIAKHCKRLGVHINFAPVADINTNPDNPIIGNRSFGQSKKEVARHAVAFMKGMKSLNVLSSAKHFPGHGDTEIDSHLRLPTIDFSEKRLDNVELYPFQKLINAGVSSVMIAHLNVPALTGETGVPTSLSKKVVTELLQKEMGFEGLVFTDALNMDGVADYDETGRIDLEAFLAGNDILLISESIAKGVAKIKKAYKKGIVTEKRLAHSVKKILRAKFKVGLNHYQPIKLQHLTKDLNGPENKLLYGQVMEKAVTLIKNDMAVVPVKDLTQKIAYVHMGDVSGKPFLNTLRKYAEVDKISADHLNVMIDKLKPYDLVVVGFHRSNANPWKSYHFTDEELVWLQEISRRHKVILNVFTSPYALLDMRSTINLEGILIGYQNSKIAQQKTAQVLFGAIPALGELPVSVGEQFPQGTRLKTEPIHRLAYGMPGSVGMNIDTLKKIDSLAKIAIQKEMTPGMQVLVARKGKVVYYKSFGYHTYDKERLVTEEDIYDLASLTKILSSLPLFMELYQKDVVELSTTIGEILPGFKNSNKSDITMKRMLSHYGRLQAWIPFYKETLNESGEPSEKIYHKEPDSIYSVQVAKNMFMRRNYIDTIFKRIKESPLLPELEYKYSGLPFYILKKYFEKHYNKSMNLLVKNHFYEKIGAYHMGYLPLSYQAKHHIIPSEIDDYWRHQKVLGYVNDQGAAMLGGVCGNAGLFSNANGVAKMMQMYLNGGIYGGHRYFTQNTINTFNTCYYCDESVRRGLIFDKPQLEEGTWPTCGCLSMSSFGHSGFTGTYTWANPATNVVYVILTNRSFPDASNWKLNNNNIRIKIQRVIHNSIIEHQKTPKIVRRPNP